MRIDYFVSVIFLFSTYIPLLFGALDPGNLAPGWWEGLQDEENEKSLRELSTTLQESIKTLSAEGQKSAEEELNLLGRNLEALRLLKKLEVPSYIKTPLANRPYAIHESLEILEKLEQNRITLSTLTEEEREKSSQIASAQEKLDRIIEKYFKEKEQTEDRLLLGLKWLNLQISLEAARAKQKELQALIQNAKDALRTLTENLSYINNHLAFTKEEELQLLQEENIAKRLWEESLQELKNKETEKIRRADSFIATAQNDELENQELLQKTLSEALAKSHLFFTQAKVLLLSTLANESAPERIEQIRKWRKELSAWKKRSQEWENQSQRQIQKTGAFITFSPQESGPPEVINREQQIIRTAQGNLFILQRLDTTLFEIEYLLDLTEKIEGERLSLLTWYLNETMTYLASIWKKITDLFETTLFHLGGRPITPLTLLELTLLLFLAVKAASLAATTLSRFLSTRKRVDKSLAFRIHRIVYYILVCLGILVALSIVGVDLSSFLFIAGALGVGLGFGLQTIFNNFISGIILLFESHIKVGDFIEISSGLRGEVREINVRSTIIATNDGLDVIVPNSDIISGKVMNWTLKHPFRRLQVPFSTGYEVDKNFIVKIITDAASKMDSTLASASFSKPSVSLTKFGDCGLEFELGVWVKEIPSRLPGKTTSEYLWMIDETLKKEGIAVPFPRFDIKILKD